MDNTIIKRPKPSDGEEELFQMQDEFLKSRQQPSAKVINLRAHHKQVTGESSSKVTESDKSVTKFRSKFAERKAIKEQEKISTSQFTGDVINPQTSQIISQNDNSDKLLDPVQNLPLNPSRIILGNIIEKKHDQQDCQSFLKSKSVISDTGFPQVFVLDQNESTDKSESLFYQTCMTRKHTIEAESNKLIHPEHSILVEGSLGSEVHEENINMLKKMTEEEILAEKARLESTLDPDLIKFLKAKKSSASHEISTTSIDVNTMEIDESESSKTSTENPTATHEATMDCEAGSEPPNQVSEIIEQATAKGWVHMDDVEPDKLEWMKDIPASTADEPAPDEPYNARFDFNGLLLPFNDPNISTDKGLHHHGEEPERPGYSLQELLQLSRSSTQQQRCTALTTLGNIMEKSRKGWYDKALEPAPLVALNQRNILLLLRFSLDDISPAIVTAALQALRSFLYSEADEICLDRLYGWEYTDGSCSAPELLPPKSDVNDTRDLKDHELAQLDCVAAAMRSDIVLRIRYILTEMQPPPVGVTAALEILIRLARHSKITALNIASTPKLLDAIVQNFIPLTTDRLVADDTRNAYGVPNVTALRLCRILTEYAGKAVGERLHNLKIIHPILSYTVSEAGEAGLRLSIEALRLWQVLHIHEVARESVGGARLMLGSQLQLLLTRHDLMSASELACERATALVIISSYEPTLKSTISTLLSKWSTQLKLISTATWSNTKLVAMTLSALGDMAPLQTEWASNAKIFIDLCSTSNLLSGAVLATERDPSSLPSLGALIEDGQLQPAVGLNCCIPFLATLCNALSKAQMYNELATIVKNADVIKYLRKLVSNDWSMESSWYSRAELFLVTAMVRASVKLYTNDLVKELVLKIAIKLIQTLPADASQVVKEILEIVLANDRLTVERLSNELNSLKIDTGNKIIVLNLPRNISSIYEEFITVKGNWNEAAMPKDWLYLPIVAAYTNHKNKLAWNESDTTKIVVVLSLKLAMPELFHSMSCSLRFSRMALVYLCDTVYLNENVSLLLHKAMSNLLKKFYKRFDFSSDLPGLTSFTDLFTAMCESFCANSYGDDGFAIVLLAPVAQKHDVHYRKLLWSEHAGALRYLKLAPERMVIPLSEYLNPPEEDVSLIECYMTALVRKTIRKEWSPIMYTIAHHHSAMYLRGTSKLAVRMRAGLQSIKDDNLSDSLLNYIPPDF